MSKKIETAKVSDIIGLINQFAPQKLAEDWDNVGLQVGDYNTEVNNILVALDVTKEVLKEAIEHEAELIIAHHPVIFSKLDSLTRNTELGDLIYQAIKADISIYVMHTNYDIAEQGLNYQLLKKLDLKEREILHKTTEQDLKKLAVFVPQDKAAQLRDAMAKEGAGWIGDYSHCFFKQVGTGSFKPLAGTEPHIGQQDELSEVKEVKLETVVKASDLKSVIQKMTTVHPYEEVAYDVYNLENKAKAIGIGKVGELENEVKLKDYLELIKERLELANLKVVANSLEEKIKKVAVCGGSGADYIKSAVAKGADLYITGDVKYHQSQLAEELGLNLVDAGHYGTEKIMKAAVNNKVKEQLRVNNYDVKVITSKINTNPVEFF